MSRRLCTVLCLISRPARLNLAHTGEEGGKKGEPAAEGEATGSQDRPPEGVAVGLIGQSRLWAMAGGVAAAALDHPASKARSRRTQSCVVHRLARPSRTRRILSRRAPDRGGFGRPLPPWRSALLGRLRRLTLRFLAVSLDFQRLDDPVAAQLECVQLPSMDLCAQRGRLHVEQPCRLCQSHQMSCHARKRAFSARNCTATLACMAARVEGPTGRPRIDEPLFDLKGR